MPDQNSNKLPKRLREILDLAATGKTDREIALLLGISTATVEAHWKRLRDKFDASSRLEIFVKATSSGAAKDAPDQTELLDQLRFEIAARVRTEQELRDTIAAHEKMMVEFARNFNVPASNASVSPGRLQWLHNIERALEASNIMIYHSEFGGDWRKLGSTQNIGKLGFTAEELVNGDRSLSELVYMPDVLLLQQALEEIVASRAVGFISEYRVYDANQKLRWIRDHVTLRWSDSEVIDYFGVVVDIHDLKSRLGEEAPMPVRLIHQDCDWYL